MSQFRITFWMLLWVFTILHSHSEPVINGPWWVLLQNIVGFERLRAWIFCLGVGISLSKPGVTIPVLGVDSTWRLFTYHRYILCLRIVVNRVILVTVGVPMILGRSTECVEVGVSFTRLALAYPVENLLAKRACWVCALIVVLCLWLLVLMGSVGNLMTVSSIISLELVA